MNKSWGEKGSERRGIRTVFIEKVHMNKCLVFSHLGLFLVPSVVVGVSAYCCMLYHTWFVQKCIHLIRALYVLLWSALYFTLWIVWRTLPCLIVTCLRCDVAVPLFETCHLSLFWADSGLIAGDCTVVTPE